MPTGKPILLLNAFSVNQLAVFPATVHIERIRLDEVKRRLSDGFVSAVGHASTAAIYSSQLEVDVPFSRTSVSLHSGDCALLGQYRGERLPEGATSLPPNSMIEWYLVAIEGSE